jgi:heme/copper-type cytochrome/quinol oxidase subunit 1
MSDAAARPLWRRLIGFNLLTGLVFGVAGFYLGWWIGHQIHAPSLDFFADTGQNDIALMLGYLLFAVGFLLGLGFGRYPLRRLAGHEHSLHENEESTGLGRYFGICTDHKVVGMQYLVGIGVFFFIGGLNAMLIRSELLRPSPQLFGAGNYLAIVGLHGTMMMGIMTSGILGPFASYFVPLMIGARRMAFPRIESFTFWLLMAAGIILSSTILFGGFPTGWTGYAPLNVQSTWGFDSYIFFFALVGISMTLLGLNMIATIVTMRAPGLTWGRLPMFCWGTISTSILMVLAAPVLIAALLMVAMDRGLQTSFFLAPGGGSPYLFQNLFWFFGHPEVYVLALPGFGIVLELLPVFARKPLWGYRIAVAGILGVMLLSFFVMAHFHYTIMGGLIFAFFAAIYYWVPKMTGLELNQRLGKIHFWTMFIAFNSTFGPLFALGLMGMPRRVSTYASNLQPLNIWVSVSAFVLGASMLIFLGNVIYSLVFVRKRAAANPWESKSLEWQVPTPVPVHDFDTIPTIDHDPYDYGAPPAAPRPAEEPAAAS